MKIKKYSKQLKLLAAACVAGSLIYLFWLPNVAVLKKHNPKTTAFIELRRAQAKRAGKKFVLNMRWVNINAVSPTLVHALIMSEDQAFYRHEGIDWGQTKAALKRDWQKKKLAIGGSTISQQLAKNLYLSPSRNPLRKLKEMIIARMLERNLSKQRILELYLNVAEWGKGIFGVQAASYAYFGKPASALSPEESVALVSILPSPRKWNPVNPTRYLAGRQNSLLSRMRRSGYLPDEVEEEIGPEVLTSSSSDKTQEAPASEAGASSSTQTVQSN